MNAPTIPDALHICPGCEDVTEGELYCDACRCAAAFYDTCMAACETAPTDDDGPIAKPPTWVQLTWMGCGLLCGAWAAAMTLAVRYIWQHLK